MEPFKVHACRFVGWRCELKWERVFLYLLSDLASTGAVFFEYAICTWRGADPPNDLSEVVMVTQHAFSGVRFRMENDYAVVCVKRLLLYNATSVVNNDSCFAEEGNSKEWAGA